MTDSLRTRIIAALARADQDWCSDNNLHEDMADAVIAELDATDRGETGWIEWSVEVDYHGNLISDLFLSREDAEKRRVEIMTDDPDAKAWVVSRFISDWSKA